MLSRELKEDVNKYNKCIVIGDFNSNPFEKSIVSASCLSALPSKDKKYRKVQGKMYKILYNPMWKFFGDFDKYPGTYYYDSSNDINYYWHIFDQVLISQGLINYFDDKSLKIVKNINTKNLIIKQKINKSISDHLPIYFSIKEENNYE